jgi:hypothetical protein
MQASKQTTDRGDLLNILHEDGRRFSMLLPTFDQGSPLSKPAANLHVAVGVLPGIINKADSDLRPAARAQHLQSAVVNVLSKPFIALQSAGQGERQVINSAKALATTVDPATPATAPIRVRTMAKWDAANLSGKAAMINNLPVEGLAAIHESGAVDELPPDLRKIATDRYMIQRHIAKTGLQADFQKKADANNPLATGPDVDAATADAQKAVDGLNARSDVVENVADVLRNIVTAASLATDLPIDRVYKILASGNVAA